MKESRRYYPKKELAAQLLGYVGVDNIGLGGIEAAYDSVIRGRDGKVLVQTDARRRGVQQRRAVADRRRHAGADHRRAAPAHRRARVAGRGRRRTAPTAAPRSSWTPTAARSWRWPRIRRSTPTPSVARPTAFASNRAVTDLYEPGSTFKIVTASAAIQEGVVAPSDPIDVSAGIIQFAGRPPIRGRLTLRRADLRRRHRQVEQRRRDQGRAEARPRAAGPVHEAGSASAAPTASPDFPGESPGIVWDPRRLNDSAVASVSMGYQVGVTPLQMAAAASAVANGGQLLQPRVVRARGQGRHAHDDHAGRSRPHRSRRGRRRA